MNIRYTQSGPFINYALNGSVLTVGDLVIDLSVSQEDSQIAIDITRDGNTLTKGLGGRGGYVASVTLPPKQYNLVDTGTVDNYGNPVLNRVALPLDTNKVMLSLWRYVPEAELTSLSL